MQAGKPPDIFQSWGGGTLKEQADAGLVKDITEPTKSWIGTLNHAGVGLYKIDDKQYGIPYNLGLVGVWYNKKLFKKAGIDGPPASWDEFLADIQKLKSAGITPIAVGEKDKWPGMFWWANLSLRVAGKDAMAKAATDGGTFTQPGFVEAGKQLKKLIALKPFQQGFLAVAVGRRRRRGRHGGQRPGGDGPDGPVGPVDLRGQHQGQEGPGQERRLVPVPDRRRRRRAGRRAVRRRRRVRHRPRRPARGRGLREVPREPRDRQQGRRQRRHPARSPRAPRARSPTRT